MLFESMAISLGSTYALGRGMQEGKGELLYLIHANVVCALGQISFLGKHGHEPYTYPNIHTYYFYSSHNNLTVL